MKYNKLYKKYKNINLEKKISNHYYYPNPISLKYKLISNFKRPKLYHINKYVEDFESFESGSKKTLREFQNLFIHRFYINNISTISHKNNLKKSLVLSTVKEKLEKKNKMIDLLNNYEKNKINEDKFKSLMKIIKRNIKEKQSKTAHSKLYNNLRKKYKLSQSSSKSMKRITFNMTEKNKHLSYQILKGEKEYKQDIEKTFEKKQIKYFREKSRLSLLQKISNKIIKSNEKYDSNNNSKRLINLKKNLRLEEYKNYFDSNIQSNFINKNKSMKYYELSKKGLNFSDTLIVKKKLYPNSIQRKKKKERKLSYDYLNSNKRPLSSLEKYFIKFGAFP